MKWEELERRLKIVEGDGVEATLYYGFKDWSVAEAVSRWHFSMSDCADVGVIARPESWDQLHSMNREDMVALRDFLCELLGDPEKDHVDKTDKPA